MNKIIIGNNSVDISDEPFAFLSEKMSKTKYACIMSFSHDAICIFQEYSFAFINEVLKAIINVLNTYGQTDLSINSPDISTIFLQFSQEVVISSLIELETDTIRADREKFYILIHLLNEICLCENDLIGIGR